MNDFKLNYDDVSIVPEVVTDITSRKQCCPYDEYGYLPIFASCMSTVVSIDNSAEFNKNGIYPVIPRNFSLNERLDYFHNSDYRDFVAFSLDETVGVFLNNTVELDGTKVYKICIDLANGHMTRLLDVVKKTKEKYGKSILVMTGNIANPETYRKYEEAGVDYCRVGIGAGAACTTSSNVGIHYPQFSLLEDIYRIKQEINGKCKIIADGGIRGYRDIQKALVFADYVMIGGLFNKMMESAGKTTYGSFYWNVRGKKIYRPITSLLKYGKEIPKDEYEKAYKLLKENKLTIWKELYGMSTKKAQQEISEANTGQTGKLKTSEGLIKYQKVEYNLSGWVENEKDYLRSAMSYTNSKTLDEYKDSKYVVMNQIKYNN